MQLLRRATALPAALSLVLGGALPALLSPVTANAETATSSAQVLTYAKNGLPGGAEGAPFPNLEVTVSQTKNLMGQGIQVSYKGGPSEASGWPDGGIGGTNFLQVLQCWGEDPANPGHPDRRTCQYGGDNAPGGRRFGDIDLQRDPHPKDEVHTANTYFTKLTAIPFVGWNAKGIVDEQVLEKDPALSEKVINAITTDENGKRVQKEGVNLSETQFYDANSTNEILWAPFAADGTGSIPFEVQTAMEASGLGCGNPLPDGTGSSCWLVVIPRGTSDNGSRQIDTPGLWWDSWEHHLAVKLEFDPLGNRCQIGAAERQLAGSELAGRAISSWQPVLCNAKGGTPYALAEIPEDDALVAAAGDTDSALGLSSRPLNLEYAKLDEDPLVYAPVLLGGVTVSYSVDFSPSWETAESSAEIKSRVGQAMSNMKLTPRLLAKLLTYSYYQSLPTHADLSHVKGNPRAITSDPEFREVNDGDWELTKNLIGDVIVPLGSSDMGRAVWNYVMADQEAREWLAGKPDPWGMKVNPWFSSDGKLNPAGALELPRDDFPKADPVEQPVRNGAGEINLVTRRPYSAGFADGGNLVLRGETLAPGGWNPLANPPRYDRSPRQRPGSKGVMALSQTPAAATYQNATALLRNPAGEFVAPTVASMQAAANAMTPNKDQPQVLELDQAKLANARGAYPLTVPVYAAINPNQPDKANKEAFARLIDHAAGAGQTLGPAPGQLPYGYAPIPKSWSQSALQAAKRIRGEEEPQKPKPKASPSVPGERPSDAPADQGTGQDRPGDDDRSDDTPGDETTGGDDDGFDNDDSTEIPSNDDTSGDDTSGEPEEASPTDPSGDDDSPAGTSADPPADDVPADTDPEDEEPGEDDDVAQGGVSYGTTPADPAAGPLARLVPLVGLLGLVAAVVLPVVNRRRRQS